MSSSPIKLLVIAPVPGTTCPEPSPLLVVIEHILPAESMTLTWVVCPRSAGGESCPGAPFFATAKKWGSQDSMNRFESTLLVISPTLARARRRGSMVCSRACWVMTMAEKK